MSSVLKNFTKSSTSKDNILHIRTIENMATKHVFLKANPLKRPQFDKLMGEGAINIDYAEYGTVIASCSGRFLTAQVRKTLKEQYNFDC